MNPKSVALQPEVAKLIAELSTDPTLNLVVSGKLNFPEKEILQAKQSLTSGRLDRYTNLVNTLRDELDIRVSSKNVSRALRFMDALIKALKTRGHSIELNYSNTYVRLFNEVREEIKLREQTKKIKIEGSFAQFEPLGKLYFCAGIGCNRRWADGNEPMKTSWR
jgi:hypothetical protein